MSWGDSVLVNARRFYMVWLIYIKDASNGGGPYIKEIVVVDYYNNVLWPYYMMKGAME